MIYLLFYGIFGLYLWGASLILVPVATSGDPTASFLVAALLLGAPAFFLGKLWSWLDEKLSASAYERHRERERRARYR
ncbi:hypothetical protein [Cryobacterium tagatosivorans]|uniref:Uncharacterized protein n=1 Tax=Cryobacterium tagatosivorans TaxID=1259199 RepID=A0A4R8UEL4_9MICO|nr:hypothetical protein [Cryobacterium tagatosivorans]TFB51959.1 hypothetical protein E3O23_07175 [Cryobacterium tagatosivorans]